MFTSDNHRTARRRRPGHWLTRGVAALAGVACPLALAPAAGAVTMASAAGAAPTAAAGPARVPAAYVVSNGGPLGTVRAGTVTPISTATNLPGKAITVGKGPQSIAITPNGKTAYVVNFGGGFVGGNTVTPISTATGKPGAPITVSDPASSTPGHIAITPNGKTAYVVITAIVGAGSVGVVPIQTATGKPGKPIPVGFFPFRIAITPNGKTAYATSNSGLTRSTLPPIPPARRSRGWAARSRSPPMAPPSTPAAATTQ
jgi:hyaluronoglucosaminidase